jgi:hypothetical protein
MNAIRNCPVTTEDVNIAKKIFGPNMSSLKGKSARRKSTPVREDTIEIPEELIANNCEIELCIDIMYVNECGFTTTINRTIRFRGAIPIENCTHEEYYRVLDMVLRLSIAQDSTSRQSIATASSARGLRRLRTI